MPPPLRPDRPILVTGGAGFIGSHFVRHWLADFGAHAISLDALTYAGDKRRLDGLPDSSRHTFVRGNICDGPLIANLLAAHRPTAVVHLAAESHVDRSIATPAPFVQTNIVGTHVLLQATRDYWEKALSPEEQSVFRFLYVSTDEVFGDVAGGTRVDESSPFRPSSPYAASKASADHLVQSYGKTFGLPTVTVHPSNTFGPKQYPEKLIPLLVACGIRFAAMPIYGDGMQIRNWLYVEDCCRAISLVLNNAGCGERYVLGGGTEERTNLEVARAVADLLDELRPQPQHGSRRNLITHVADRPGHDRRYMTDYDKISRMLGWKPVVTFQEGLRRTVQWYLENLSPERPK